MSDPVFYDLLVKNKKEILLSIALLIDSER